MIIFKTLSFFKFFLLHLLYNATIFLVSLSSVLQHIPIALEYSAYSHYNYIYYAVKNRYTCKRQKIADNTRDMQHCFAFVIKLKLQGSKLIIQSFHL